MPTVTTKVAQTFKKPNIAESYGTFATLQAAMTYIENADIKCAGLTVGIDQPDGGVKEYWLQPVEGQLQFVEKGGASGDFVTEQELQQGLSGKQDTIQDLQQIRSRADEGHTALQPLPNARENNFANFDENGGIKDSGKKATDFATATQGTKADSALQPKQSGQYTNGNIVMFDDNGGLVDSGKRAIDFITKSVNDLANYYLKSETYTKAEVTALIAAIQQFHYEIYTTLPANGENNVLYLIGPIGMGADRYEEYVYANNAWTKIGDTSIDLSGYVTTSALNTALADYTTTASLTTLLAGKQDTISDLSTIRSGAAAGATAVQPNVLSDYVQKSATTGLLKNDGTVDSQTADKAASALQPKQSGQYTQGDIVVFDENGGLADSQKKTTDFATSTQGSLAETAYQKPQSGIPSTDLSNDVQTSLGKADAAVQQVTVGTTTTGTAGSNASVTNSGTITNPILDFTIPRGADGQDAVNPFKGWYDNSSNLPSNPVIGDYAYVKGAATTDPAAIYECTTAGSWTDSGRTADTSNVQTFASGEEVNEVYIDNEFVGGSDKIAGAEEVSQLKVEVDSLLAQTVEDGFFIVDENLNVGASIDNNGIHVKNIVEFEIIE